MSVDKFVQDGQDPKIVEKIHDKLLDMLTSGESINYIAVQKKPAVTILPDSIAITNRRLFLCEFAKLGLATNFEIFQWKEIKDVAFKEEIFGSKVTLIPLGGENISVDYIPKTQARKLYQLIKEAIEENQDIQLEVSINSDILTQHVEEQSDFTQEVYIQESEDEHMDVHDELTQKLTRLKNLYDKQLITQAEYELKKSELLSEL